MSSSLTRCTTFGSEATEDGQPTFNRPIRVSSTLTASTTDGWPRGKGSKLQPCAQRFESAAVFHFMYPYKKIKLPNGSTKDEHRIVMEQILGRILSHNEDVHHINGNKRDNRPENLVVMSRKVHMSQHPDRPLPPGFTGPHSDYSKHLMAIASAGCRNGNVLLSEEAVGDIRTSQAPALKLAHKYSVCVSTVYKIKAGLRRQPVY